MKRCLQNNQIETSASTDKSIAPAMKESNRRTENNETWKPPDKFRTMSLKSVAGLLDTTSSSARRWLKEAGVRPIALGRGARGAIRCKWEDIEAWLKSREYVE